tara:strand:- start:549 stop:749 length:201 start_codon:yes stop_codon:yes gene_type:complete
MATNSIGKGRINLSVTITEKDKVKIVGLAKKSGLSQSQYCRKILRKYLDQGTYFGDQPELTNKKKS